MRGNSARRTTPAYATGVGRAFGCRTDSLCPAREVPCRTPWRVERGPDGGKFRRDARKFRSTSP
eukprot:6254295-Prymnesium_polylepis.1